MDSFSRPPRSRQVCYPVTSRPSTRAQEKRFTYWKYAPCCHWCGNTLVSRARTPHLTHSRLVYSYECEWAWAVCSAYMARVRVNACVPSQTLAFLERTGRGLPNASLHSLERSSPHFYWTFEFVVDFMLLELDACRRHHHCWADYTNG